MTGVRWSAGGKPAAKDLAGPPPASAQPSATAKRKRAAGEPAAAVDGRVSDSVKGGAGDARRSKRTPLELLNRKKRKVQPANVDPQLADSAADAAAHSTGEPAAAKSRRPRKQKPQQKADPNSEPSAAEHIAHTQKQSKTRANGLTR